MPRSSLTIILFLFCSAAGFTQPPHNGTNAFVSNVKPALEIRRAAGAIQIDGELNAFTIFYIGSTHQYPELDPNRNDLTQTSRQFFMKFQYLVRI